MLGSRERITVEEGEDSRSQRQAVGCSPQASRSISSVLQGPSSSSLSTQHPHRIAAAKSSRTADVEQPLHFLELELLFDLAAY